MTQEIMDSDRDHSPQDAAAGSAPPLDAIAALERRLALAEARIDSLAESPRGAGHRNVPAGTQPGADPATDDDGTEDAGGQHPDLDEGDWDDAAGRPPETILDDLGTAAEERRIRFRETAMLTRLMEREANELRDQVAELQSRLATAEADNERLRARVLSGKEEMQQVKQRARAAESERASLLKSTSWKVTKPLRALNRTLKKVR